MEHAPAWVVIAVSLVFIVIGSSFLLLRNILGHVEVSPLFYFWWVNSTVVGRKGMVILNQLWGIFFLVIGSLVLLLLIPSQTLQDFLIPLMFLWSLCFIIIYPILYFDLKRHPRNGDEAGVGHSAEKSEGRKDALRKAFLWIFTGLLLSGLLIFLFHRPPISIMVAWFLSLMVFILKYIQLKSN